MFEWNLAQIMLTLNNAFHESADPPDSTRLQPSYAVHTGKPGRPRIEIDPIFLAAAYELRGPQ